MIPIVDWISKPPVIIDKNKSVFEAVKIMAQKNMGSLLIVEKGKPTGIVTERDVMRKVVALNVDPKTITVEHIMTPNPVTVDIKTSFVELSKIMNENGFRRVVITKNGKVEGIITSKDIVKLLAGTG